MFILLENLPLDIIYFLLCGIVLAVIQKKKIFIILIISLFFLLAFIDKLALMTTAEHVDLFCFLKINLDMVKYATNIIPDIIPTLVVLVLFLLLAIFIICKTSNMLFALDKRKRIKVIIIYLCLCVPLFCVSNTASAYVNLFIQGSEWLWKTENIFWNQGKYLPPEQLQAEKGKNLVIIYLESFENSFVKNDEFKSLTPNLRRLLDSGWYSYDNYQQLKGADSTVLALYATQTSFPCFFPLRMNYNFSKVKLLDINSWAHILKIAGYKNIFMDTDKTFFGGKEHMLELFGYDLRNDLISPKSWEDTPWKGHDFELFEAAKKEYLELLKTPPFNLTLLTVDTHFPAGFPDSRLEERVNVDKKESVKFTIASTDLLVGDFIDFINKQPGSEDTIIIILGDHLMMGSSFVTKLPDRRILLMTNKRIEGYDVKSPIYFYDMPRIILDILEVKNNAVFSKDLIPEMSPGFVTENVPLFMKFHKMKTMLMMS